MKVITKAGLIAKFGEHNGTIFWNRHVQAEATKTMLRTRPEGFDKPKKAHKETNFVIPSNDVAIIKHIVQNTTMEPRMVHYLAEATIRYYAQTDTAGMSVDIAEAQRLIILELKQALEAHSLRGMRSALQQFWS